jgi:hypothetical protein
MRWLVEGVIGDLHRVDHVGAVDAANDVIARVGDVEISDAIAGDADGVAEPGGAGRAVVGAVNAGSAGEGGNGAALGRHQAQNLVALVHHHQTAPE